MLLKSGDKGIQVKYLQQGLKIMCCNPGAIDAAYGPGTQAAVEKFQEDWGLTVDGIVGDDTWNCLAAEIKPIQQALKEKGFYSGAVSGVAKDTTYDGVVNFQSSRNLTADGMVGAATRARLFNEHQGGGDESMLPLSTGDRGDYVLYLQYGLKIMCCSPGPLDGIFGASTFDAVKKFQEKYGVSETGMVNVTTWSVLKRQITNIQQQLSNKGYSITSVDGLATSALAETIKKYQKANWLTADGQVGPSTYSLLFGDTPDGAMDALPLKLKSRGPRVLYFQYALRVSCINPNGTDGVFGVGTETAVNRYKIRKNLTTDSMVDTVTWEKMRDDMRPLQIALANRGYDVGYIDGIVTKRVYDAILKFQTDNHLTADGMVGNVTKLLLLGGTTGSGTVSSTLKLGSNGSLTRYLQHLLCELGYAVSINGVFNQETQDAVIAFQSFKGLDADGVVGGGTWSKLFESYRINVTGSGVEKLIKAANHELSWGFAEDNANNITPYGQWYGMNGSAWCAMFVSYCAYQAGVLDTLVPKYAWSPSGMTWYKNKRRYHKRNSSYIPKKGDIIFFYNDELGRVAHTGIVVDGDANYITTIEGNTTIDAVEKRTYSRNHTSIDGYGDNGGEAIERPIPPTQAEITDILLGYYRDFLDDCYIVLPSEQIKLDHEASILMPPSGKILVEASADASIFDNSVNNDVSVICEVSNGVAVSNGIDLTKHISVAFEGLEKAEDLLDVVININASLDTGSAVVESGIRTDAEGTWVYMAYVIKKEIIVADGYPSVNFVFKYTYCWKSDDSTGTPFFELITDFIKDHYEEMAVAAVGVLAVTALIILSGSNLPIDIAALAGIVKKILDVVSKFAIA